MEPTGPLVYLNRPIYTLQYVGIWEEAFAYKYFWCSEILERTFWVQKGYYVVNLLLKRLNIYAEIVLDQ